MRRQELILASAKQSLHVIVKRIEVRGALKTTGKGRNKEAGHTYEAIVVDGDYHYLLLNKTSRLRRRLRRRHELKQ